MILAVAIKEAVPAPPSDLMARCAQGDPQLKEELIRMTHSPAAGVEALGTEFTAEVRRNE